ncbi:MAG: hypothetical protein P4L22_02065 [Candidatus Babeliales bacterium]|nr:hypothetical protein [Candidatus Babeliales bacterium]
MKQLILLSILFLTINMYSLEVNSNSNIGITKENFKEVEKWYIQLVHCRRRMSEGLHGGVPYSRSQFMLYYDHLRNALGLSSVKESDLFITNADGIHYVYIFQDQYNVMLRTNRSIPKDRHPFTISDNHVKFLRNFECVFNDFKESKIDIEKQCQKGNTIAQKQRSSTSCVIQ